MGQAGDGLNVDLVNTGCRQSPKDIKVSGKPFPPKGEENIAPEEREEHISAGSVDQLRPDVLEPWYYLYMVGN